ncbi:MAG: presqualene diphosphate synthase HpnD [Proteobacteria bacterium]|nr:presqualene diphosphate synthase HpnD [Pseudomonadota bacterium]MDA0862599.1 presqualene diphosphate synthase HpnD [Pseudomonadota bacterium]MDA1031490.1 presqualene diphosphate synthase HpnD [Pseudomonadota bacterium]
MTPQQYCANKTAQSGSSFYYSFLFLEKKKREAITALYAFCREVDDIVDDTSDEHVARSKLNWWDQEIEKTWLGTPQHPVTVAIQQFIEPYKLERKYFKLIIDGMMMDLERKNYETMEQLTKYCYRSASAVGILSASIFGYSHPSTLIYAEQLGLALQITNILRDIQEDLVRGRVYIPLEEFDKVNIKRADLRQSVGKKSFDTLIANQVETAQKHFDSAERSLHVDDRQSQKAGLIMSGIYQKLLAKIASKPARSFAKRQTLTPIHKLWIAWRIWSKP